MWTYDYTKQQLADELDFRVEAVHAKRAQEELESLLFGISWGLTPFVLFGLNL